MRAVELFAGAGGMSLGLMRAGIDVIQAYDSWKPAIDVYRRNVGPHVWQMDLKDIFHVGPMIASLAPDMIVGGPPCQDFSAAGERVEGERAALTRAFAMLVVIARPEWILMENVPLAARSQSWVDSRAIIVKAGYGLTEARLDASFYGVPQRRRRLFVVGRLGEQHGFLDSAIAAARSERAMTMREMLTNDVEDLRLLRAGAFFTRPYYEGRGVRTLDEPAPAVIRTSRERPRPKYLKNPHPDDPISAIDAALLTQQQVSRIQGFPSDWDWSAATSREVDQMIANAVPSPLAEAVARVILARESGETIPALLGRFGVWLADSRGYTKAAVRNAKSRLNRTRRLLDGRTFKNGALELAALEEVEQFKTMPTGTRSDLRKSLGLYREWLSQPPIKRRANSRSVGMTDLRPPLDCAANHPKSEPNTWFSTEGRLSV
ncbi:DNA (cytosine-5)-methyltransferase 1 [Rhodopseudomonas thermotolerans]|uniref:DNA (cytosine-5-)-methyltransferase n=2 Tax=Rhodopseudomonas TaxID=1073 RepID=A0A336JXU6_9BRAD|nr:MULTISPECIES: DNA cytosine methyltransferase [Rhodopseudomonas]RED25791.1 DNA (cytosine-5)-methyltransferase 1 [Rhodopseudomonas pentothenatexigens]REF90420.1 DNA (cytosine-5)-methyltransferase 1 [Rhodopseudomonas thermotolerans]SSW93119.1 DNA (cytosine-5)-methyltransferase 1 [Rhodopseudomonas pentothenatexigens]